MTEASHFLLRLSGELSLKGKKTRHRFVDRLVHNLADALRSHHQDYRIERRFSRLIIKASSTEAGEIAARVFGVKAVAAMEKRPWSTVDDLLELGSEIFAPDVAGRSFAVRVHRGEHATKIHFKSPDVERALGARLKAGSAGVDLSSPDVEAHVELRGEEAYFYARPRPGEGGLPIGTEGRALALVSGGFDSPVAAWAMMRRGVRVDFLFCNLGGEDHLLDVIRVMKVIADRWSYGVRPKLIVVDARPMADELRERTDGRYGQILLKRQMLRLATGVALSLGARVLVTGEAIGQVSSQTLSNLAVTGGATAMPVIRPLVARHKEEIFALARHIGTFEPSSRVAEYCGLDSSSAPVVEAKAKKVESLEESLDPSLLSRLIDRRMVLDLRAFDPDSLGRSSLEIEQVPEGATLLDLRPPRAFADWHPAGALHLPYPEALESFRELDRAGAYVVFCELGLKSAHLAEVMAAAGYRAHHLRGGAGRLARAAARQDEALLAALSPVHREGDGRG